jgi:hypothetical protein
VRSPGQASRVCYDARVTTREDPHEQPGGPSRWLSRRTVCIALLLFAAALACSFWVEIIGNTLDGLDVQANAASEPEYFAYTSGHNFDFFQYYAGGHNWRLGLDPYLNHPDVPNAIHHPRHEDKTISGYIYPPTLLPAFGALARLDYADARHTWFVINVVFFALGIAVAAAVTPGRRLELITAAVLLTMCSYPFFYHVHQGQIDMIVAALAVSSFLLYPRWRGWPSAALIAVAILVKLTPVLLLAVMVIYFRDLRFLLKTVACLAIGLGLSLLAVAPHLYVEYFTTTLPKISVSSPDRYNQTLVRFWSHWPVMVKALSAFGYAALLFFAYVAGRNSRRIPESERTVDVLTESRAVLTLAVLMTLIFSPLAWQMAYVIAIVPVAALLIARPPRDRAWAPLGIALGAALISSRIFDVQVLNLLNVLGGSVVVLCVLYCYLPLRELRLPQD